eukprot:TRINITY_DN4774_c0_g2_i1.p1 TRINITY_DN4774_c0_g2~~TRINITY_DN4774_c0_g2_i1.p1  ORF type:complete len:1304 (-),score=205.90 TRINITY_DN4774_c0_g2_i1:701-4612(-)
MGVPKFFRWLSSKYPNINLMVDDIHVPDFDNLYLDMNGIIHRCSHPSDNPEDNSSMTESEIFLEVFRYLDQLFQIIKPKKYFYLAVDGPAPRAKMNQQRSRRFRAGKATEIAMNKPHSSHFPKELFDSNCITPGTEFMDKLSYHLEFFIQKKINDDPLWRIPKIIYSSHLVPGEGEHKIMDFVRKHKVHPEYDPNTRHCIYGLDADLIMLGLASHEPHFALLREVIQNQGPRRGPQTQKTKTASTGETGDQFHLLHLSLLRDYITLDVGSTISGFEWDKERIIDDIILLFMFVGNDFLPHLPRFDIANGTLDLLFEIYPIYLSEAKEYLQDSGEINLKGLAAFFRKLPLLEEGVKKKGENKSSAATRPEDDTDECADEDEGPSAPIDLEESARIAYYEGKFQESYAEDPTFVEKLSLEYVKGLCWVSTYYYQGCPSWDWYFPYHYAPLASDLSSIPTDPIAFEKGIAVLPFKQLLAVLPPFSAKLLPAPYRKLMCDKESPLAVYYPKDFEVDMNGKKNEWEGVVIIPFIDWDRFSAIIDEIPVDSLSHAERRRNTVGTDKIYFHDPSARIRATSPLPELLRDIQDGQVHASDYNPSHVPLGYVWKSILHPLTSKFMDGFPTLFEKEFTAFKAGRSRSERRRGPAATMLNITQEELKCTKDLADNLLGKIVMIGWPHSAQGKVLSHCDGLVYSAWDESSQTIKRFPMDPDQITQFESEEKRIKGYLEIKQALKIDQIKFLFSIQYFYGYVMGIEGLSIGGLSKQNTYVPFSLIRAPSAQDEHLSKQTTIQDVLSVGDFAIYTNTANPRFVGSRVKIVDIKDDAYEVEVQSNLWIDQKTLQDSLDKYHPFNAAQRYLRISSQLLSKITGSIRANPGNVEIGLGIKFTGKELQMNGYVERDFGDGSSNSANWVFSDAVLDILYKYVNRIRPIIGIIESSQASPVDITPILGDRSEAFLSECKDWISELPLKKLPLHPYGSYGTSIPQCAILERVVQDKLNSSRATPAQKLANIPRAHLANNRKLIPGALIPSIERYQLADRVAFVGTGTIPYGLWGTVISINPSSALVEVIFDDTFLGGTSLHGRCQLLRGLEVNVANLLNITASRTSRPIRQPQAPQTTPTSSGFDSKPKPAPWKQSSSAVGTSSGGPSSQPRHQGKPFSDQRPQTGSQGPTFQSSGKGIPRGSSSAPTSQGTKQSPQPQVASLPTTQSPTTAWKQPLPQPQSTHTPSSSPATALKSMALKESQNTPKEPPKVTIVIKTRDTVQASTTASSPLPTSSEAPSAPTEPSLAVLTQQLQDILQIGGMN